MDPKHSQTRRSRASNESTRLLQRTAVSLSPGQQNAMWRRAVAKTPRSLRKDIWTVLRYRTSIPHDSGLQFMSYVLELCILTLILMNVLLAISESSAVNDPTAQPPSFRSDWYQIFLLVSTVIFSVEYALRIWSCVEDDRYNTPWIGRFRWMLQPMSIIDLVALIPFYLELCVEQMLTPEYQGGLTIRGLRLLRIVSFLRLERSYSAMKNLRVIFVRKKEEFLVVSYLTAVLVLVSSTTIFFLENTAQPDVFSSIGVCAWWSIETITSLGYGDIVPKTNAGRFFSSLLALWGIILFTIPGAVLGSGFIEVMLDKQRTEEEEAFNLALRESFESANECHMTFHSDNEGDGTPRGPTPPGGTRTFRNLSPRVTSLLRLEGLHQKVDEVVMTQVSLRSINAAAAASVANVPIVISTQRAMQLELRDQAAQLEAMSKMLQTLVAASASTSASGSPTSPTVPSTGRRALTTWSTDASARSRTSSFRTRCRCCCRPARLMLHLLRPRQAPTLRPHSRALTNMLAGLTGKNERAHDASVDASENAPQHDLVLDRFCLRHFDDPDYKGTQIKFDKAEFERRVNEIYLERSKELVDGYAPFCKHLFIENFTDARCSVVKITQSNSRLLLSEYEARAAHELPVLVRWFPSHSVTPVVAKYLDIILYSREQIRKENEATGQPNEEGHQDAPWGIISVKAQDVDYELPMNPITLMRNALGKEEGGSGVPLNRDAYMKSVEYWKNHAIVK
ncbi:TPA: hypothetical protein N0F65_002456 [Lagenidium giganteum]|uniref:Ion transport domain-containing protein n=1 Tax=Lagenidium giganteum TaxID=4803 RepID=A0AAV2YR16_9STRA|nr:TPA: hypothetical protein N0F65_002456 [Lagenidium giganteum]